LCGNPAMIDDATTRLVRDGWSLQSERFWYKGR
jgi:hypothetical protein